MTKYIEFQAASQSVDILGIDKQGDYGRIQVRSKLIYCWRRAVARQAAGSGIVGPGDRRVSMTMIPTSMDIAEDTMSSTNGVAAFRVVLLATDRLFCA